MNPVAPIYVGQLQNGAVWIRVEGKGSFQNSQELKEFATLMITRGSNQFVIDLENCPVMDSTFMGTLVGIKKSLVTDNKNNLEIINANSRNTQLLVSLGIDLLLKLDTDGNAWPEIRNKISNHIQNGQCSNFDNLDPFCPMDPSSRQDLQNVHFPAAFCNK